MSSASSSRRFRGRRRIGCILLLDLVLLLLLALGGELVLRLVERRRGGDPVTAFIYPIQATAADGFADPDFTPERPEGLIRVLCLGGSTSIWQNYADYLAMALRALPSVQKSGREVEVYTAGQIAQTSLDSLLKYRYWYAGYEFDAVVFYQAINDLRANNCPPEYYRPRYEHLAYYHQVLAPLRALQRPLLGRSRLFVFLTRRATILADRIDEYTFRRRIPSHAPRPEWLQYGRRLSGFEDYVRNVREIARLARERSTPLLLMTFCVHIPQEYTKELFLARKLPYSYTGSSKPAELWGLPGAVRRGIRKYNAGLRRVAREEGTLFLDQAASFPRKRRYFIDVCHFTRAGVRLFTRRAAKALDRAGIFGPSRSREGEARRDEQDGHGTPAGEPDAAGGGGE
jgi:hypothetical protein